MSTKGLELSTCLSLAVTPCFHFIFILIVYFFNKVCLFMVEPQLELGAVQRVEALPY